MFHKCDKFEKCSNARNFLRGMHARSGLTAPTLHLCMVTWPGLVPSDRPLLEDWAKVFKKKWQSEVCGLGTFCIRYHKELSTIRRVVMWQHLDGTVWNRNLWAGEVKCLGDLWVKHAHHLTAVAGPPVKMTQLNEHHYQNLVERGKLKLFVVVGCALVPLNVRFQTTVYVKCQHFQSNKMTL